ncbi:hypothetical protein ACS0TY_006285 [Phlomoides rotata]
MDRRSWLWRRKSSHSGETESSAGSLSSHSERFSDDQTLNLSNRDIESPEVTSKAAPDDYSVSEKLSVKEELVKQHAKVAEEAVSGWERAENEVSVLKKQNEALTQKNLFLEERIGHLDGALKECLRQHRQAREEDEDKLEAAEKDKAILKLQLEISSRERDLSTRAAEAASKQHLDAIRRVAKLEAECLQLKARARRATNVESFTDSHSDNGERVQVVEDDSYKTSGLELERLKHRTSLIVPSVDIYLMDDFLEMERLVSLPESTSESSPRGRDDGEETRLRDELEAMINRTTELEDTLKKITAEKLRLEIGLSESQIQLKASEAELEHTDVKLLDLKIQLALAQKEVECTRLEHQNLTTLLDEAEKNLEKIQHQLKETNQAKRIAEVQLEDANVKKAESEARLKLMGTSINMLESEVEKEKNVSRKAVAKCEILEGELSRIKSAEFRINQDKEVAMAASKFADCQKTIASLGRQLKSLATLDDFLFDSERQVTVV